MKRSTVCEQAGSRGPQCLCHNAAAAFNSIPGGWTWDNPRAFGVFFLAMVFPGAILLGIVCAVDHGIREGHARREPPSESLLAFRRALAEYKSASIAARRNLRELAFALQDRCVEFVKPLPERYAPLIGNEVTVKTIEVEDKSGEVEPRH